MEPTANSKPVVVLAVLLKNHVAKMVRSQKRNVTQKQAAKNLVVRREKSTNPEKPLYKNSGFFISRSGSYIFSVKSLLIFAPLRKLRSEA